jgi:CheY-like chemotaxis protein
VGVGTGIGLSISRSIVERHRGHLRFEPVETGGARFVVELPAMEAASVSATVGQASSQGLRHALIIDDEPDVSGALADILELMGVKSRTVTAWTSAGDMLDGEDTDIVFSDLRMPGIDGAGIYRALLEKRPDFAQRFVLVTGDILGARAEVDALPAHLRPQILEKPFSTLDVRGVLTAISDQVALSG